jgi:importin subunit alpha-1
VAALKKCRILLSISDNDRIEDLVSQFLLINEFVPLLIKNLKCVHDESQLEAAWCITNIASSSHDHTMSIIGAVPDLINYLSPHFINNSILQEQCAWALGNIAGDCVAFCRLLVRNGALTPQLKIQTDIKVTDVVKTAAWCLSNITHGIVIGEAVDAKSQSENIQGWNTERYTFCLFESQMLDVIHKFVCDTNALKANSTVLCEVMWLLSHLTRVGNYEGLVMRLLVPPYDTILPSTCRIIENSYLSSNVNLLVPCLRILGNLLRGPDNVIEHVISSQPTIVGQILLDVISGSKSELAAARKEGAWVIANLASGSPACIDGLMRYKYLEHILKVYLRTDEDAETAWVVKRELTYALTNLCGDGRYLNVEVMNHILNGMQGMVIETANFFENGDADDEARASEVTLLILNFWKFLLISPLQDHARNFLSQSCKDAIQRVQSIKSSAPVSQILGEVLSLLQKNK